MITQESVPNCGSSELFPSVPAAAAAAAAARWLQVCSHPSPAIMDL